MSNIHGAIVEILSENAEVAAWATGGIWSRRAPSMEADEANTRRDKYIVVKVEDSDPTHKQVGPSNLITETINVMVWAHSGADCDEGDTRVRWALDAMVGTADGLTIQRIFWRGSPDEEDEDADRAEQRLCGARCRFDVAYIPTPRP